MTNIRLERTVISVREDVGVVPVCIALPGAPSCPVEYDFTIVVMTRQVTAGMAHIE